MITALITVASMAIGLFSEVKKNEAAQDAAKAEVEKQAAANLRLMYEAESDMIEKQTALDVEKARLATEAKDRQEQYNKISIAAFAVVAFGTALLAVNSITKKQ